MKPKVRPHFNTTLLNGYYSTLLNVSAEYFNAGAEHTRFPYEFISNFGMTLLCSSGVQCNSSTQEN